MITLFGKNFCESCFAECDKDPCEKCGFSPAEYQPDAISLPVGHKLQERYLIGGVIGQGGFGITYTAFDTKLERRVAIKEYYPYGIAARTPGAMTVSASGVGSKREDVFSKGAKKFYEEARLVAKFSDTQNIVSIYDFFYENSTVYYVMEYLQGQSLKSYTATHGVVSPEQAVFIAKEVSKALISAHSANILHRDIAPDNIMLCDNGKVKLIDFGAARQFVTESSQSISVILKQGYTPLEQYQKKGKQGPWTDIYALGATVYFLITGDLLDDPMTRMDDDEPFSSNTHDLDEGLFNVIKKATMLKPADRYKDVAALQDDLNKLSIKALPITVGKGAPSGTEADEPDDETPEKEDSPTKVAKSEKKEKPEKEQPPSSVTKIFAASSADKKAKKSGQPAVKVKKPIDKKNLMQILIGSGVIVAIILIFIIVTSVYKANHINIGGAWYNYSGTTLKASSGNISDLSALSELKELTELSLDDNSISDISALKDLSELTKLNLASNTISDISALKDLSELTYLDLNDNEITDISALTNLTGLTDLNLQDNDISDLSPLKNLDNLERLELTYKGENYSFSSAQEIKNFLDKNVSSPNLGQQTPVTSEPQPSANEPTYEEHIRYQSKAFEEQLAGIDDAINYTVRELTGARTPGNSFYEMIVVAGTNEILDARFEFYRYDPLSHKAELMGKITYASAYLVWDDNHGLCLVGYSGDDTFYESKILIDNETVTLDKTPVQTVKSAELEEKLTDISILEMMPTDDMSLLSTSYLSGAAP